MIRFTIPLKTRNPLNGAQGSSRGAVFAKAARRKKERGDTHLAAIQAGVQPKEDSGLTLVTITRISAGTLDGDGLQASLKSVRDGLADALGVNDASPLVEWRYLQRKCGLGEFGVEITIAVLAAPEEK